jgi:hypothetical protein
LWTARRWVIMQASVGDELTVRSSQLGIEDRHGLILEVHGQDGAPPYLVRWRDENESLFYPSSDTVIEHRPAARRRTRTKKGVR